VSTLIVIVALAIAVVVFYLYMNQMFKKDALNELPKEKKAPILLEVEPQKAISEDPDGGKVEHRFEPGIEDSSYQEIIMGPSEKNIYQSDDYYEGSPADEPMESQIH
jgi:hypothetical protein